MAYHYFSDQTSNTAVTPNFIINAEHKPGHYNVLADSLSCFSFQELRRLCPAANIDPILSPPFHELRMDQATV